MKFLKKPVQEIDVNTGEVVAEAMKMSLSAERVDVKIKVTIAGPDSEDRELLLKNIVQGIRAFEAGNQVLMSLNEFSGFVDGKGVESITISRPKRGGGKISPQKPEDKQEAAASKDAGSTAA